MTDEELIARLRLYGSKFHHEFGHNDAAADRIEALSAERDAARQDAEEAEAYAEESEAKLAKAVELLTLCRDMLGEVASPSDPLSVMLNETLAEIKGESHE